MAKSGLSTEFSTFSTVNKIGKCLNTQFNSLLKNEQTFTKQYVEFFSVQKFCAAKNVINYMNCIANFCIYGIIEAVRSYARILYNSSIMAVFRQISSVSVLADFMSE